MSTTWPVQTDAMSKAGYQTASNTFVPIIWSDEVLATRESNLVVANSFRRINHKGKPGDTIRIPFISDLTANSKTAATAVTIQVNAEGLKDISLDQHYEVSFLLEDFGKVQSAYDLRKYYTEKAGYSLGKKIDQILGAAIVSGLNANYKVTGTDGSTAYAAGNEGDITDSALRQMKEGLDNNDVPQTDRVLIVPPSQINALMGIDKFVLFHNIGNSTALKDGTIGRIYGFDVKVTTALGTTGNATIGFCGQKEAAAVAIQQDVRTQAQYKNEYLATLVTNDVIFGVKLLRGDAADTTASNYRKSHVYAVYVPT